MSATSIGSEAKVFGEGTNKLIVEGPDDTVRLLLLDDSRKPIDVTKLSQMCQNVIKTLAKHVVTRNLLQALHDINTTVPKWQTKVAKRLESDKTGRVAFDYLIGKLHSSSDFELCKTNLILMSGMLFAQAAPEITPGFELDTDGVTLLQPRAVCDLKAGIRDGIALDPRAIIEDIGKELAAMHRARVYHGDVKASNVLIDKKGKASLTDFDYTRPFGGTWPPASEYIIWDKAARERGWFTPLTDLHGLANIMEQFPSEDEVLCGLVNTIRDDCEAFYEVCKTVEPPNVQEKLNGIFEGQDYITAQQVVKLLKLSQTSGPP